MREKELRLALICYGGISLAVYMHGISKEIWHLVRASQAHHGGGPDSQGSEQVYRRLLESIAAECGIDLRVLVDILTGASAGGINAIFLAEAISAGRSLDPLTELWLETADVDRLIDPEVNPLSRMAKTAAVPFAWALSRSRGGVEQTVEPEHREEIRTKLANFVRARWFAPPFSGSGFTNLLLSAFDAMTKEAAGPALLPYYQPLDLFVTVTDFHGHPERLRLNSPAEVPEREHRLTLSFRDPGGPDRQLAEPAELVFAARATASFPGAFPPFQVGELDAALAKRGQVWAGRDAFLEHTLPRHAAIGDIDNVVLIDGSVLANAPFHPAIHALQNRPTRREVDRRFVYIDPKPGIRSVRLTGSGASEPPGFFATIFGALSDIPREQPIRDNLEAIDNRSSQIRRMQRIVSAMRPQVEAAIENSFGSVLLLGRPTPKRLAGWRIRAQKVAARDAGYTFAAYVHLKLSEVVEEIADRIFDLGGGGGKQKHERVRQAVWAVIRQQRLNADDAITAAGACPELVLFLRKFDLSYRVRRLRFLARRMGEIEERSGAPRDAIDRARGTIYDLVGHYGAALAATAGKSSSPETFRSAGDDAAPAMTALAEMWGLRPLDEQADERLSEALASFPKVERRAMMLTYLGFPFYDIATLPLLQGEGLDEYDPIKVDRISPDDAVAIRQGGAAATLKGIQLNSFGAFFSRAYRENDYLWGRLHGADRLIDIVVSTLPEGSHLPAGTVATLKRDAFRLIVDEERPRLTNIAALFEVLDKEIG
ncbi:patatin-like protein [Sphingosinicella rhizophila]|uniref:Patatin-like protein n=1 Tax=Sphingosinicella rhizophila TaxID=3050082 RepID=A0ABU3Q4I7_9SPHN|nr:patatin-like protein [Sphingosinicella sp. GR2756]MDT9597868.1 patatin-like protein [Sphingosinicella sp. GR2756]